jgi:hypothetical protein
MFFFGEEEFAIFITFSKVSLSPIKLTLETIELEISFSPTSILSSPTKIFTTPLGNYTLFKLSPNLSKLREVY